MTGGILEIAIVLLLASVLGILAKLLKQPTILAYLATGIVIASFGFFNFDNQEVLKAFSDIGIMLLLFLVGLEMNYKLIKLVGKESLIGGLAQIIIACLGGFGIAKLFNFSMIESFYIGIALAFSSTIVVVQLLSDKKAINSLYGKLSIGFLLVQDFVAILVLVTLSGIESGATFSWSVLVFTIIKGFFLFGAILFLGRNLFPYIFNKIAKSRELLFLSSLAWLFVMAGITKEIGFSVEIGGFLAGLALANSSENFEISLKVRPLRDFFIVVFFAILGSSMALNNFSGLFWPILILSIFVLIGTPIVIMIIMGLLGYEKRTSFFSGVTLAQISEFGLLLGALGLRIGHIDSNVVALITAVGVITITVSTYFIVHADSIFRFLSDYLSIFERKNKKSSDIENDDLEAPIILIGCHRTGESIAASVSKEDILIIDFDPSVVQKLRDQGYKAVFGDVSDVDIFEKVNFSKSKVVVSTSPNLDDNLILISRIKDDRNGKEFPKIVVRSDSESETIMLYEKGADYVLMPNFISGHYISRLITIDSNFEMFKTLKKRDIKLIKKEDVII
jgi:Kef-type K+ transport system membrane component KefB